MAINYVGIGLSLVTCGLETGMDLPELANLLDDDTLGGEPGEAVAPDRATVVFADDADNTGGTFTISETKDLSTNRLYTQPFDGEETNQGAISGDGVINVTLTQGTYIYRVVSFTSLGSRESIGIFTVTDADNPLVQYRVHDKVYVGRKMILKVEKLSRPLHP